MMHQSTMSTENIYQRITNTDLKTLKAFALLGNDHCVAKLLDKKYLSLLPPDGYILPTYVCRLKTSFYPIHL